MLQSISLASLFGFAGVAANVIWPLMKSREHLLAGQVVACLLMFIHFALLGASTGAAVMATAGVQAAIAIPLGKSKNFRLLYLASLTLTPAICYLSWHGPASAFSSLALAIVCIANYQQSFVLQRVLLMCAILAWIAHNILVASVPALVSNALTLCTSSLMLYRTLMSMRSAEAAA
jgi:Bacterial inner membrane protein